MLSSPFIIFLIVVYLIIWTNTLVSAIRNPALTEIGRFMWVFIITMTPIIGLFLYWFLAPSNGGVRVGLGESVAKAQMTGIYEKTKWENR